MKKTFHLILGVLLLPLALGAQSLPKAEEAFEKGDYAAALAQYKQLMQSATGDDRLHAQLRYAACQFGLGEYLNAAKTIWGYTLPENDLWKARFLLYRIQLSGQTSSVYRRLLNERQIDSKDAQNDPEAWTKDEWEARITQDYETLWAMRAALINAPIERETLILNVKATDTQRIPTLFDYVVFEWQRRLTAQKPVALARLENAEFLDGYATVSPQQKEQAEKLAYLLKTAYLLDGKGRQNAKIFWQTDFILLPFTQGRFFELKNKEKALNTAVSQLNVISGLTPQTMGFWNKIKGYVSADNTDYGRSYAAYQAAELLWNRGGDREEALKIARFGKGLNNGYYATQCARLEKQILQKELSFNALPKAVNPQKIELSFTARNAKEVFVRVYKTSYEELLKFYRAGQVGRTVNSWDFLTRLSGKNIQEVLSRAPYKAASAPVTYERPYFEQKGTVALPALENGFYFVLASYDASFDAASAPVQGAVLNATDLALFVTGAIEDNPDKYVATLNGKTQTFRPNVFRIYTANLKTGAAEGNVNLDIITTWKGSRQKAATQADGSAAFVRPITVSTTRNTNNNYFISPLAEKDGSRAFTPALYFHFYNNEPVRMFLQTDRAIYRPGEKVYLSLNAFETLPRGLKVLPNHRVGIKVSDASGNTVFTARPTANAMGTAQAEFTLPDNPMLGYFQIQASLTANKHTYRTYQSFQVEEYKRPDYEITLSSDGTTREYNKETTVTGQAQYYFGSPLAGAAINYTVTRQDYLPPFYWWKVLPSSDGDTVVAQGTAKTDEKGSFKITFTPRQQEKDETFAKYVIKAEVLDESGRAISTQKAFTVSTLAKLFKLDFTQGFYDANTQTSDFARITLTNADGNAVTGKVSVKVSLLENTLPQTQEDDRFYPRPVNTLENQFKNAKEVKTAFTRDISFKKPEEQVLSLPALPEGVYRLTLKADKAGTQSMVFVVADTRSQLQLPDVTLFQRDTYYPGETARVLLGAGNLTGSKRVEVYRGETFLTRKDLLPGGVSVYTFPVEQEERGGLALAWFGASNYTFHQGQATVKVPFNNKDLTAVIDVPNEVRPGQETAWKLTVKDASGRPVQGQASLTVYDKSLDYYAKPEHALSAQALYPQNAQTADRTVNQSNGYFSNYFTGKTENGFAPAPRLPASNLLMTVRPYPHMLGRSRANGIMFKSAMASAPQLAESKATYKESFAEAAEDTSADEAFETAAAPNDAGSADAPRTNFAATAYFNPALPIVNGQSVIKFTLPQSLTAWNILGFALTKNADFGAFTASTVTRKDFMVRLQMPRFYREGDKGVLQAAVTNLTGKKLTAEVALAIQKDQGNALADFGLTDTVKRVAVGANATEFVTWEITAPNEPALYGVTATARSGKASDGEQKTLPVYPGRQRTLATVNTALKNGQNTLELTELNDVPADDMQTAVLTINPSLALSVLNTMPNLLTNPYKDLVSTLNRYAPLAVVHQFYTTYPQLKQAVSKLPKRTGQTAAWNETDPLRLTLLEQTPWLRQAQGRQSKTADLVDLFNPETVQKTLNKELTQLKKFQNESGAFAWFPGGQDDDYLTLYALNAFASAVSFGAEIPQAEAKQAIAYILPRIEQKLKADKTGSEATVSLALYAAYTLSAFPQNWAQITQAKPYLKRWADYAGEQARFMTALGQTYAAVIYHRLGDDIKANQYLDLVLSRMKQDKLAGAYFAPEAQSWVWYRDTITTQTATLRALTEIRPQAPQVDAMAQWLLFNRQVNEWNNSKAASQAVFTLLDVMKAKGALSLPVTYQVNWAGEEKRFAFEPMDWTKDLQLVRTGRQISEKAKTATITKQGAMTDFASLSVLYQTPNVKASPKGVINVTREYFTRFTQDGVQKLRPVQDLDEIKVGDEVEVHLTLTTDSAFEYVLLDDPKPAGFESEELTSGWEWDKLSLYRETRDAATRFFINWVPAGKVTLSYVLRPTVSGKFRALPAQAQSMYAPEFGAHTGTELLTVDK